MKPKWIMSGKKTLGENDNRSHQDLPPFFTSAPLIDLLRAAAGPCLPFSRHDLGPGSFWCGSPKFATI